ncbi:hypothetical protein HG535_0A05390 [Zygotorulaspora mrakii]|uniref:S-methyl-5'-thioadenosine phosphorylase n=1 Tax=Zygotorulaspora mrakii TaxID=42260 RepID=A0A7H9AW29_ZYGMR|nr:uncharacterized protein HG535_0A05390 [Zygotorulaspora mrakii]QLG70598.1 hypothetical protein HG535_0A05390 [Zygotorulaspora mrakii]
MAVPNTFDGEIDLGIIGGTGLYHLECLEKLAELPPMETPWGTTSSPIVISKVAGDSGHFHVAFIARHGRHHQYPPSKVPFRANMASLKHLKCKAVLSFSAVGSLQEKIKPRDFVLPQQIIDRTKGIRNSSFLNDEGLVGHVGFGDPFSYSFAQYIYQFKHLLANNDAPDEPCNLHFDKETTVVCMEGPQFSTRAESKMYRMFGGDVINMSVIPEAKLARECELPYQMICMSTDYDAWRDEEEPVTVETVIGNLSNNGHNANLLASKVIEEMANELPEFMKTGDGLRGSIKMSISTKPHAMSKETLAKLNFLFPDF